MGLYEETESGMIELNNQGEVVLKSGFVNKGQKGNDSPKGKVDKPTVKPNEGINSEKETSSKVEEKQKDSSNLSNLL
jgi:hypothetical protein